MCGGVIYILYVYIFFNIVNRSSLDAAVTFSSYHIEISKHTFPIVFVFHYLAASRMANIKITLKTVIDSEWTFNKHKNSSFHVTSTEAFLIVKHHAFTMYLKTPWTINVRLIITALYHFCTAYGNDKLPNQNNVTLYFISDKKFHAAKLQDPKGSKC